MKTYYFKDLVIIKHEGMNASQIKECENRYGELVAVGIPKQGIVMHHDKAGDSTERAINRFFERIKDYREVSINTEVSINAADISGKLKISTIDTEKLRLLPVRKYDDYTNAFVLDDGKAYRYSDGEMIEVKNDT